MRLRFALSKKAEESITEVFFWPDGKVEFEEGATSGEHFVHIDMELEPLIFFDHLYLGRKPADFDLIKSE